MIVATKPTQTKTGKIQYATFYIGELLLGLKIDQMWEINRQLDVTPVPHAPEHVRGVINLRGDVVTVVDLARILGIPVSDVTRHSRNVVIQSQGQLTALLVDRISDILSIPVNEIHPPPANIRGAVGRFVRGVYTLESDIVVLLDVDQILEDC